MSARWGDQVAEVADALVRKDEGRIARELPSREALRGVIERLHVALFAAELGPGGLDPQGRRAFVHLSIDEALRALAEQVGREPGLKTAPDALVRRFMAQLAGIRDLLETDLAAAVAGDPAASSTTEVLLCYPGFYATLHHRIAHALHRLGAPLVARAIAEIGHAATAIDIHPGATIGERFFIDHGSGVVIGETAELGRDVRLYQGVTLGARSFPVDAEGKIVRGAPRHPILEDEVHVYAGATILGRVTIGRGSVIGGGVWLTRSVPAHSRILQAPVRADAFADGAGI